MYQYGKLCKKSFQKVPKLINKLDKKEVFFSSNLNKQIEVGFLQEFPQHFLSSYLGFLGNFFKNGTCKVYH